MPSESSYDAHWKWIEDNHGVEVANAVRTLLRVPGAILLGAGTAAGDLVGGAVAAGVKAGADAVK